MSSMLVKEIVDGCGVCVLSSGVISVAVDAVIAKGLFEDIFVPV